MDLLNILTIISYIALNVDIVLQILQIKKTKSSKDLSIPGLIIRFLAILIITIKFVSVGDGPLIAGQIIIAITFTIYFALAVMYSKNDEK